MAVTKQQGLAGLLVVAASIVTSTGTLYGFAEQVFAGEIKQQIAPVLEVQRILLQADIQSRRREIAALEFKREMCGGGDVCWTLRDAQDLANARAELAAREVAIRSLQ